MLPLASLRFTLVYLGYCDLYGNQLTHAKTTDAINFSCKETHVHVT